MMVEISYDEINHTTFESLPVGAIFRPTGDLRVIMKTGYNEGLCIYAMHEDLLIDPYPLTLEKDVVIDFTYPNAKIICGKATRV